MSRGKLWNSQFRENTVVIEYICCITSFFALSLDAFIQKGFICPPKFPFFYCFWLLDEVIFLNLQFCSYLLLSCYYKLKIGVSCGMSCDEWEIQCGRKGKDTPPHTRTELCEPSAAPAWDFFQIMLLQLFFPE